MNRREFMDRLERLLSDVPLEDRVDALQYYEDYFEDAGVEKEQDVINELGSPLAVADIIKRDLGIEREEGSQYKDYRFQRQDRSEERQEDNNSQYRITQEDNASWQSANAQGGNAGNRQSANAGNENAWNHTNGAYANQTAWNQNYQQNNQRNEYAQNNGAPDRRLLIILFICTLPITIGPFIGVFAGVFGLVIGFFAAAFGLIVGGVATFGTGIGTFVTGMFADGILLMGVGLILFAIGLLLTLVCSLLCRVVIPTLISGCRKLFAWLFRGEGIAA